MIVVSLIKDSYNYNHDEVVNRNYSSVTSINIPLSLTWQADKHAFER